MTHVPTPSETALVKTYSRQDSARLVETALIESVFLAEGREKGVMVDVGVHYGGSMTRFMRRGWDIYGFEPDPKNRGIMEERLLKEEFRPKYISTNAVSNVAGQVLSFYTSEKSAGISSLNPFHESHEETGRVTTTTISNLVEEQKLDKIHFLKIDVEGFDLFVLKGVPWKKLKPRIILCEFEDLKTEKLGYKWEEMADYLVRRGYTVYVSEWHPIIAYGQAHEWHALTKYPCQLTNKDSWGNLIAFKRDPGEEQVAAALKKAIRFPKPKNKGKKAANAKPQETQKKKTSPAANNIEATQRTNSNTPPSKVVVTPTEKKTASPNVHTTSVTSAINMQPASQKPIPASEAGFKADLRRKSPALFRVAQISMWGLRFLKRHFLLFIIGICVFSYLIFSPLFIASLAPYSVPMWIAAALLMISAVLLIGAGFANMMANRIAQRELQARISLKNELFASLNSADASRKESVRQQKEQLTNITRDLLDLANNYSDESFKKEIDHLVYDRLNTVESKFSEQQSLSAHLNANLERNLSEIERLRAKLEEQQKTALGLKMNFENTTTDVGALRARLNQYEKISDTSKNEINRLILDVDKLQSKVDYGQEKSVELINNLERNVSKQQERNTIETIQNIEKVVATSTSYAAEKMQVKNEALRKDFTDLEQKLSENISATERGLESRLSTENDNLRRELKTLEDRLYSRLETSKSESADELKKRLATENKVLRKEIEALEQRLSNNISSSIKESASDSTAELENRLATENEALRKEIEALEQRLSENIDTLIKDTASDSTAELENRLATENEALRKEIEALEQQLSESMNVLVKDSITKSASDIESRLTAAANDSQEQLSKEAKFLRQKIKSLEAANEKSATTEEEVKEKLQAIQGLKSKINKLQSKLDDELARNSTSYMQAQEQLELRMADELKKANMSAQKSADKQSETITKLSNDNEASQAQIKALKDKSDSVLKKLNAIKDYDEEINLAKDKINTLEKNLSKTQTKLNRGLEPKFHGFNRVFRKTHIQSLEDKWYKNLNFSLKANSVSYIANRIRLTEGRLKGRLATSIETAVLRTLVTMSVQGKSLEVLEIGTLFGTGTAMIHDRTRHNYDRVHFTVIDPLEGYYGNDEPDIATGEKVNRAVLLENFHAANIPDEDFTLLEGFSTESKIIEKASKTKYDVLIIDGDHSLSGVKSDFINYAPFVKRGGYIIIDDYGTDHWPEIKTYVDNELLPRGDIALVGAEWRTAVFRVIKKVKT